MSRLWIHSSKARFVGRFLRECYGYFMVFIVLPVCVVFVVGNLFYSGETSTETLYNATGGVLGYIDSGDGKVAVRNSSRSVIGYVDDNGTYDKGRKTIAKSRLPGLLFCHE